VSAHASAPFVSVVIPNWNGQDLLAAHLPSIEAARRAYPGKSELIVVDDGSRDGSAAFLREQHPEVRVVAHATNRGFGPACWSGAQAARAPLLVLLNSDVSVDAGFLEPLVRPFEDPRVFATSPLIFDGAGRPSDVTLSVPYLRRGKVRYRRVPIETLVAHGDAAPSPWVTLFPLGGAFAVRRDRFLSLGGWDDLFHPFYYEDTDLGLCAWRRGWTCQVVVRSRVSHDEGGTIGRSYARARIRVVRRRNRLLFTWKNLTSGTQLAAHLAYQALRVLERTLRLDFYELAATLLALPRLRSALARRQWEIRARVRQEEEIFREIDEAVTANFRALATKRAAREAA
jgi:GT2 family glycosyltransferase